MKNLIATLLLALWICSCSKSDECEDIKKLASNPLAVSESIEIADAYSGKNGSDADIVKLRRARFVPGQYKVDVRDFQLDELREMEVSLMLGSEREVDSVFIGEGSMRGLIVSMPGKSISVLPEAYLLPTASERVFLVCRPRK